MSVDILIPVANGIEFLFESVQSVVAQTYKDWNCWIVLNGIGLHEEAKAVATAVAAMDARIHVLESQGTNKCEALNDALTRTKAPWIALLDVDDRWLPTKLQAQLAIATSEMSVIGTHTRYFGSMSGCPAIPTGWIDPAVLPTVNPLINSSVLIRRPLAHWTYGPGNIAKNMEDYYLWMRLALAGHCFFNYPAILTEHRVHPASAFNSQGTSPEALQKWFRTHM
jgi:glycosyltransferase involved in cell wall biosynthesis